MIHQSELNAHTQFNQPSSPKGVLERISEVHNRVQWVKRHQPEDFGLGIYAFSTRMQGTVYELGGIPTSFGRAVESIKTFFVGSRRNR